MYAVLGVRAAEGLWTGDDDAGRSHTTLIFDTEQHALGFTDFMATERQGSADDVGIAQLEDFLVVPVIAETRLG